MKILGISSHYHDSAAALLIDGVPVASVQEERISRRKNDAAFPLGAIEWCLRQGGLTPEQLDAVVFYEKPMLKFERILTTALLAFPYSWRSFPKAMQNSLGEKMWIKGIIQSHLDVDADKILFCSHHLSHAAAAFLGSPSRNAAILTADGVGEWATLSLGVGKRGPEGTTLEIQREIHFPHSLGMLYSTFTAYLGFEVNEGEYKVMGLASYGTPNRVDDVRKLITVREDGSFELDMSYFEYHTTTARSYSNKLVALFGPPRRPYAPLDPRTEAGRRFADIAASVQRVLEEVLVGLAKKLRAETGLTELCLGGGVALNGCANAKILREAGFERVYVPPAPGDSGCALGAALWADRIHFQQPDRDCPDHPYWGPSLDAEELCRVAREDGLSVEEIQDEPTLLARVAEALAAGLIVGWMDGGAELGPRALGHRSILAAPDRAATRDRLNQEIKYREEFRPFAPAVPLEDADTYFELPAGGARMGTFMSGVFPVRPAWRERLAAITHVDGTARLQTVESSRSPRFYALLRAFGALTGVPVLVNTSFNLAGEPIVTRAIEGYATFRRCGIDLLVGGPYVVRKSSALGPEA